MNAPMQPDAPEWLVTLLAEHEMEMYYGDPEGCACGFADWENHRAHVAAVVWAAIIERAKRYDTAVVMAAKQQDLDTSELFADDIEIAGQYAGVLLDALGADDD